MNSEEPIEDEKNVVLARAERVRRFLDSDLWLKDISPALGYEQAVADVKRSYNPLAAQGVDEPEQFRAYYAGVFDSIENIPKILRQIIEKGDQK